jgi:glucosamine--fructose-6-phosphate aminotransferase (isomerizing)
MCGIIGFIGNEECKEILLNGIKQLQNRGYDSAGIATFSNQEIIYQKYASTDNISAVEKLDENIDYFKDSRIGIAHTRWATHGKKNDINSHPHYSNDNKIFLVHNGIIENFSQLKKDLQQKGVEFYSETDTEVIANLLAFNYQKQANFILALKKTLSQLEGTWGLVILNLDEPNKMYCVRHGSPLLVSHNSDFALLASEQAGFNNLVNNYFILQNNDICILEKDEKIITCDTNEKYQLKKIVSGKIENNPSPFQHWTLKEIHEQYESTLRTISFGGRIINDTTVKLGGLIQHQEKLETIDNIIFLGCGTSFYAAQMGIHFMKKITNFNTIQLFDGAEFEKHDIPKNGSTAIIMLSQSGETKDLHRCINIGKENNLFLIGIINVVDSMIAREVDCGMYLNCGREIGVASTKCFTSMVIAVFLMSNWFSQLHKCSHNIRFQCLKELRNLPIQIKKTIDTTEKIITETIIPQIKEKNNMFVLGKGAGEAIAKEGALKIKEISYMHAEGYSGSSLKHGPFALLCKDFPVVLIAPKNKHYAKMNNTYQEILSREAKIIFITDDTECTYPNLILIPENKVFGDLLSVIPLQLIAYYLSLEKAHNPDFPRNLAKSVVVE